MVNIKDRFFETEQEDDHLEKLSRITLKVEHECLLFKINLEVHILLRKRDVSTFVKCVKIYFFLLGILKISLLVIASMNMFLEIIFLSVL